MTRVVLDGNVVLAAIGWGGTARLCLKLAAKRRLLLCVTSSIL
jgi:predicted nucleic acid-binding protein